MFGFADGRKLTAGCGASLVLMGLLCAPGFAQVPVTTYSIQVGAFETEAEARRVADEFATVSRPVAVTQAKDASGKPFKTTVGTFCSYAKAYVFKSKLPADFAPGCFIVKAQNASAEPAPNVLPVSLPFDTTDAAAADGPEAAAVWAAGGFGSTPEPAVKTLSKSVDQLTVDDLRAVALAAPRHEKEGRAAIERLLAADPKAQGANQLRLIQARVLARGADPAKAKTLLAEVAASGDPAEKAMARFLRAHARINARDMAGARDEFCALASDRSLPPSMRREAMRRAAGSAHAAQDYPTAWLAFDLIQAATPATDAAWEAQLQQVGLAFELCGRSKGTWVEVRAQCVSLAKNDAAPRAVRATAALMGAETLFNEEKFPEALAGMSEVIVRYPEARRECCMARLWQGIACVRTGRLIEARTAFDELLAASIAPGDCFAKVNPRAHAAVWLAHVADQQGDLTTRQRCFDVLKADFPQSEDIAYARRLFPGLL